MIDHGHAVFRALHYALPLRKTGLNITPIDLDRAKPKVRYVVLRTGVLQMRWLCVLAVSVTLTVSAVTVYNRIYVP